MSASIKYLLACLALVVAVASSPAAAITNSVTFNFEDILQRAYVNRSVTVESVSTPRTNSPNIAVNYYLSTNTGTSGSFVLSNMLDGTYRVSVLGNPRPTTFLIGVPTNNPGTHYASDLLTTNIDANATTAWTRSQADGRFVRANTTNFVLVSPTNFFWANITNGPNVAIARGAGGKLTISATNSGGGGSGELWTTNASLLLLGSSNAVNLTNLQILQGRTLVVATNGNNAAAARNNLSAPFSSIAAAQSNLLGIDTIEVRSGIYSATLSSNPLNINLAAGAQISNSLSMVYSNSTTSHSFKLTGRGTIGASNGPLNAVTGGASGALHFDTAGTSTVDADLIYVPTNGGISTIYQSAGNLTINATTLSNGYDGQAAVVWWDAGNLFLTAGRITSPGSELGAGIYALPTNSTARDNLYVDAAELSAAQPVLLDENGGGNQMRYWLTIPNIIANGGDFPAVAVNKGFFYLTGQKVGGSVGASSTKPAISIGGTGVSAWLGLQKVSTTNGYGYSVSGTSSRTHATIEEFEDLGGTDIFAVLGGTGTNVLLARSMRAAGGQTDVKGVAHTGGTARVVGTRIDLRAASATNAWPVYLAGPTSNLTLNSVTLLANTNAYSIFSTVPAIVDIEGTVTANRPVAPNVTLRGGWFVNTASNEASASFALSVPSVSIREYASNGRLKFTADTDTNSVLLTLDASNDNSNTLLLADAAENTVEAVGLQFGGIDNTAPMIWRERGSNWITLQAADRTSNTVLNLRGQLLTNGVAVPFHLIGTGGGGGGNVSATNNPTAIGQLAVSASATVPMILFTNSISNITIQLAGMSSNQLVVTGEDGQFTNLVLNPNQFVTNVGSASGSPSLAIKVGVTLTNAIVSAATITNSAATDSPLVISSTSTNSLLRALVNNTETFALYTNGEVRLQQNMGLIGVNTASIGIRSSGNLRIALSGAAAGTMYTVHGNGIIAAAAIDGNTTHAASVNSFRADVPGNWAIKTNLSLTGSVAATNGYTVVSNSAYAGPTLTAGQWQMWSSNGMLYMRSNSTDFRVNLSTP